MSDIQTDYPQLQLEENIPLSDEEIQKVETDQRKITQVAPAILGGCTLFVMALSAFFIKDDFSKFKYYDYILFAGAGLVLLGFAYLMYLLVTRYDRRNWKKDKISGKNKLSSIVIDSDTTEYGEYLTFAGPAKNKKIRLLVTQEDYSRYKTGTKVVVTYLKYSKSVISISEL
ncbi:hypothetical protein [Chryseobacterium sp. JV558]|uniref:hypothetical protein n=1 Tax=Chryseobacterium sp. JV558 TaxID=2663236 RepID=UPI00299EBCFF|nr:hypothetical protein [Chryseobacterium sp. JV558]MDW9382893.1 hypothetical protein [Chryseobacterium sp. JV558]